MKKNKKINIPFLILCGIFLFSIFKMSSFLIEITNNKNLNDELIKDAIKIETTVIDNEEVEQFKIDFDSLASINQDIKGWIRFNEEKINYPFVQSYNNSYYLNRSFNKKKNSLGTIFMDYRNLSLEDQNVVLFGHNSTDGSMFGSLKDALKDNYFNQEENRIIELIDIDNTIRYYEIFSIYTILKEEYYITTEFNSDIEYKNFLETIKNRSIRYFDSDLTNTNNILTLSTCNGVGGTSNRLVIHAKLKDVI